MSGFLRPQIEVGSNLFELVEFSVTAQPEALPAALRGIIPQEASGPLRYGVNVAKIREVIRLPQIVPCRTTRPEVLGLFNLRGVPIPVIHLARALGYSDEPVPPGAQVIVTEFSRKVTGFVVSATRRIRRVSWDKVLPPPSDSFHSMTGMLVLENSDFLFIIDFEKILSTIDNLHPHQAGMGLSPSSQGAGPSGTSMPSKGFASGRAAHKPLACMVVDDSPTARKSIADLMRSMGFSVIEFMNGHEAWQAMENPVQQLTQKLHIIISDVEMPKMDGYSLVKNLKSTSASSHIPVVLHSSLTGEANRERARQAGADAYVAKFNRREFVAAVQELVGLEVGVG